MLNDQSATDRSLVLAVRPPSIVSSKVLREFSRTRREWWSLPGELCLGGTGQANLLQQQVYDDCTQNQVFYFVVTNLKYWVFGKFVSAVAFSFEESRRIELMVQDSSYTSATVSAPIHFRAREPSAMQCLATWVVKSVDEVSPPFTVRAECSASTANDLQRPRAIEATRQPIRTPTSPQLQAQASIQAPAYSPPSRRPARTHTRAQSYPAPQPQQAYSQAFGMFDAPTSAPLQQMWQNQYPASQYPQQHGHPGASMGRQNSAPSPMMADFGIYPSYGGGQAQAHGQMQAAPGYTYGQPSTANAHVQAQAQGGWGQGIERPLSPYENGSDLGHAQHGHGHGYGSFQGRAGYVQPQRAMWYGSTGWGFR